MSFSECLTLIQSYKQPQLLSLWQAILNKETELVGWPLGKAFEFLILQAFKLEGAYVIWPYEVNLFDSKIEQIDGVVYLSNPSYSVLIESKDYNTAIHIEPIAKMRSQLQRRSNTIVGSVFSVNGFTEPALTLARFLAPQTILLWNREDIEYCIEHSMFIHSFTLKYRHHVEHSHPDFSIIPFV